MKISLITRDGIEDALADPHPTISKCMILRKWADDAHAPTRAFPVTGADGSTAWRAEISRYDEENNWPKVEAWLAKRDAEGSPYTREKMLDWLKQAREGGCYLASALVHMCRFLGLGAEVDQTLAVIRERSKKRTEEHEAMEARRKQQLRDADKAAMDKARADFIRGDRIATSHFERLCEENGVEMHIRTIGTLRKRIAAIGHKTILGQVRGGGMDGVHSAAHALKEALTAPKEPVDPVVESLFRPGGTTATFNEIELPKCATP
jgi:hypothetical protein